MSLKSVLSKVALERKKAFFDTQKDGNILTTIELGLINGSNYLRLFGHTEWNWLIEIIFADPVITINCFVIILAKRVNCSGNQCVSWSLCNKNCVISWSCEKVIVFLCDIAYLILMLVSHHHKWAYMLRMKFFVQIQNFATQSKYWN